MFKITDDGYSLPSVVALGFIRTMETGANKPILITGVDSEGRKGEYVVKLRGGERMSSEAFLRELLAAFIATQMGIPVVTPVIINVSALFVESLIGNDVWQCAGKSLGYNFGSEYLDKHITMVPAVELNASQLQRAQLIFAFDVLIQNADRTIEKPNMFTDGAKIVIYDHEVAFGFIHDIFENKRPWEIREIDLQWINKHLLLRKIKGRACDFDDFSQRFDNLDEKFWETAKALIPSEWQSDQFDRIKQHFQKIVGNKERFIVELKKLMS